MSKRFKVGDRVQYVGNADIYSFDILSPSAVPEKNNIGTIKTVCDVLPWYSIQWDVKEKDKDYSPWYSEEMLEEVREYE